ncbi:unnamed protein product [Prorocentrum cordatum]|uniref:RWD domain-containing protein n=1 Tax=Prorocentrum cordatum TaxID=2364126 RepID=A0ABN9VQY9_9DINO|nr:unnamed protein product [Polarella glacialis]
MAWADPGAVHEEVQVLEAMYPEELRLRAWPPRLALVVEGWEAEVELPDSYPRELPALHIEPPLPLCDAGELDALAATVLSQVQPGGPLLVELARVLGEDPGRAGFGAQISEPVDAKALGGLWKRPGASDGFGSLAGSTAADPLSAGAFFSDEWTARPLSPTASGAPVDDDATAGQRLELQADAMGVAKSGAELLESQRSEIEAAAVDACAARSSVQRGARAKCRTMVILALRRKRVFLNVRVEKASEALLGAGPLRLQDYLKAVYMCGYAGGMSWTGNAGATLETTVNLAASITVGSEQAWARGRTWIACISMPPPPADGSFGRGFYAENLNVNDSGSTVRRVTRRPPVTAPAISLCIASPRPRRARSPPSRCRPAPPWAANNGCVDLAARAPDAAGGDAFSAGSAALDGMRDSAGKASVAALAEQQATALFAGACADSAGIAWAVANGASEVADAALGTCAVNNQGSGVPARLTQATGSLPWRLFASSEFPLHPRRSPARSTTFGRHAAAHTGAKTIAGSTALTMTFVLAAQAPPEQRGFVKHRHFIDDTVELDAHMVQAFYRPPGSFLPIGALSPFDIAGLGPVLGLGTGLDWTGWPGKWTSGAKARPQCPAGLRPRLRLRRRLASSAAAAPPREGLMEGALACRRSAAARRRLRADLPGTRPPAEGLLGHEAGGVAVGPATLPAGGPQRPRAGGRWRLRCGRGADARGERLRRPPPHQPQRYRRPRGCRPRRRAGHEPCAGAARVRGGQRDRCGRGQAGPVSLLISTGYMILLAGTQAVDRRQQFSGSVDLRRHGQGRLVIEAPFCPSAPLSNSCTGCTVIFGKSSQEQLLIQTGASPPEAKRQTSWSPRQTRKK